jgi:hypothetical protein
VVGGGVRAGRVGAQQWRTDRAHRPMPPTQDRPRLAVDRRDHHRARPSDGPTSTLIANPRPHDQGPGAPATNAGPEASPVHPPATTPSKITGHTRRSPYDLLRKIEASDWPPAFPLQNCVRRGS